MQTWKLILKMILTITLVQGWQVHAQTMMLLSPTGDGGFESGTTFATNGWTVQNYTANNANKWFLGAVSVPSAGTSAAYISNNATGTTYNYNIATPSKVMFWRDITFPAGYYSIELTFKIKVTGEGNYDDLSVFFQSGAVVPVVATQPATTGAAAPAIANTTRLATLSVQGAAYTTKTYTLNAGNATAATTRRLIFYWESDNSVGVQPPASIDEISVTACMPPELTAYADTSRCGPGSVTLHAEAPAGVPVNWYTAATGGTPVYTGNNYTTPVLSTTTSYYVAAAGSGSCQSSRKMVTAHVYPIPVVSLGSDINICIDPPDSVLLNAGTFPAGTNCLWNDGNTNASRYATQSGTYRVIVTNTNNCKGYDTIQVTLRSNPTVYLGNDTTLCNGGSVLLDAGPGQTTYAWNTGANTQKITLRSPGTFNVKVTNALGCSKSDTITITWNGEFPHVDNIIINNNNSNTYFFEVDNPRHITTYEWDFGDNSPRSSDPAPTHTYAANGTYQVVLRLQSSCGSKTYTRSTSTVGIEENAGENAGVSIVPNPANGKIAILLASNADNSRQLNIYDMSGRLMYTESIGAVQRHEIDISKWARGFYVVKIVSDKGALTRKFQRL